LRSVNLNPRASSNSRRLGELDARAI
jgi:hypothetical protein